MMKVWRMMAHHERQYVDTVAAWARTEGLLAIGHGSTGDLRACDFASPRDISILVRNSDPNRSPSGCANDGKSMWRFFHEVNPGDLVIVNAPHPQFVMRVTGPYFYQAGEYPYYEHRRKAELTTLDASALWTQVGGIQLGQGRFCALVLCA